MKNRNICIALIYGLAINFGFNLIVSGNPLLSSFTSVIPLNETTEELIEETNSTNGTHKDLYVIKAVVYEIGILTEVNDDDNSTDEDYSHERVDLTFFDAHSNGSTLDLGSIPLPVQTNISGQVLTGIAPVHIGQIQEASDIFNSLPLTGTIVNISHSDTSFITLSHEPKMGENGTILDVEDLVKIPGFETGSIQIDNTPRLLDEDEDDDEEDDDTVKAENSKNDI